MDRKIISITKLGDENIFYGATPNHKGMYISTTSTDETLGLSESGRGIRRISNNGEQLRTLSSPNFGIRIYLPDPIVETDNDGFVKVDEEVTLRLTNVSDYMVNNHPDYDLEIEWYSDVNPGVFLYGKVIRDIPDRDVTWSCRVKVYHNGTRIAYSTITRVLINVDDDNLSLPVLQSVSLKPSHSSMFRILNSDEFEAGTVFTTYRTYPDEPLETSIDDFSSPDHQYIRYTAGIEYGYEEFYIVAEHNGVETLPRKCLASVVAGESRLSNNVAFFDPFDKLTGVALVTDNTFGKYGTTVYLQVRTYKNDVEIYVRDVENALLLKRGVFRNFDLVPIQFNNTANSYDVTIDYLIRTTGAVGGKPCEFVMPITVSGGQDPYDFKLHLGSEYHMGETGNILIDKASVSTVGTYYYTIDQTSVDSLGLTGNASTHRPVDNVGIDFTTPVLGTDLVNHTVTINIYNVLNVLVKTLTHELTVDSDNTQTASGVYTSLTDHRIGWNSISAVNIGSNARVVYSGPTIPQGSGVEIPDTSAPVLYDLLQIANPVRMVSSLTLKNKLNVDTAFDLGDSKHYPHTFFRQSDVTNFMANGDLSETVLRGMLTLSLDINASFDSISACAYKMTTGLALAEGHEYFSIRRNLTLLTGNPLPSNVGYLAYDGTYISQFNSFSVITNRFQSGPDGTTYAAITALAEAFAVSVPDVRVKAYLFGPGRRWLLLVPTTTQYTHLPIGKTRFTVSDGVNTQLVELDPDNDSSLIGKPGVININNTTSASMSLSALSYGMTIQLIGDDDV